MGATVLAVGIFSSFFITGKAQAWDAGYSGTGTIVGYNWDYFQFQNFDYSV